MVAGAHQELIVARPAVTRLVRTGESVVGRSRIGRLKARRESYEQEGERLRGVIPEELTSYPRRGHRVARYHDAWPCRLYSSGCTKGAMADGREEGRAVRRRTV